MKDKATPRPWALKEHGYGASYLVIEGPDQAPVCGLWIAEAVAAQQRANARLIVKAVNEREELIGALRRVLKYFDDSLIQSPWLDTERAILRKAEED